jgi:hypothetical protein
MIMGYSEAVALDNDCSYGLVEYTSIATEEKDCFCLCMQLGKSLSKW